ncbi:atlastin-2-like [Helicoverpa zea]|uniref:atlastin-2-like n=1 Tax=Helicoverpa zea TaxID=7113 RepID=UPI001F58636A|nr:atlastin-2-like [Helicoverpa zea]XP_047023312.1 atlastin-2-like [Helicoverpa zea]
MSGGMNMNSSEGLQVVKLGQGAAPFELDVEALQRVLLRPEVRHLPVALVSVAGAYRGGKSFMLDFFLRYLNADRDRQLSGEWLGAEDDPLSGFHWRGGCERDTTGIHLWPHPVITTLDSTGEKVAVLLMDTQGTFDSETTIGQNSTIFALSTLISSVQIYNLSGNIREDDLQHLQLFTEYGRLACEGQEKAFQNLTFLVRDWMSEFEHPHGYSGGEQLLRKRLQSKPNQKAELREVRAHICSCFDQMKCFLMPHPGLSVANQTFTGCLRDLTEKFRLALLEFVPSLFDPRNLTPKLVNGERVTVQDLVDYFQKYVDIFNSDEVPEAVTIFKATAAACLAACVRAAREVYEARMSQRVRDAASLPPALLARCHAAARLHATQHYHDKKKLGSQDDIDHHYEQLNRELEATLSVYMWKNEAKLRETVAQAKQAYDAAMSRVCGEAARVCLHPLDLERLHADALAAALAIFDAARQVADDVEDEQRTELERNFEEQLKQLRTINEHNNDNAVSLALEGYVSRMRGAAGAAGAGGLSAAELRAQHDAAAARAREHFAELRNAATDHKQDPYLQRLREEIERSFVEVQKANENNNLMAVVAVESAYRDLVMAEWGPPTCCMHPRALLELHERVVPQAMAQILDNRLHTDDDGFREMLQEKLSSRYAELKSNNEYNNRRAVEQALAVYTQKMDKATQPSLASVLVAPFIVKLLAVLPARHDEYRDLARRHFRNMRRGPDYGDDCYYDRLNEEIEAAFEVYSNPTNSIMREIGFQR